MGNEGSRGPGALRAAVRRVVPFSFLALAVASAASLATSDAGAAAAGGAIETQALPPATTWSDRGVDAALLDESGSVRVRVLLRDQALLAAASGAAIQGKLQPAPMSEVRGAARRHPRRISAFEKRAARRAEATYEDAVAAMQPSADAAAGELERVESQVRRLGGRVLEADLVPAAVIARIPVRRLRPLFGLGSVQAIEAAPKAKPQSSIGWQAVGAPSWFAAGLTGGTGANDTVPADAGVNGELPDPAHPAFSGVDVDNDPQPPIVIGDHGTHTASIIASQDATNRGVAYGIDRLVNGTREYQLGFTVDGIPGAPDPAEVINSSFGYIAATDDESDGDDIATAFLGVSQAFAAGNDNTDGSPTVDNIGRNTMSVAALNDLGTVTSTDDVVLGISARGPTPGGRKKPDLIAPGAAVVAASSHWDTPPANPDYTAMTGTSFSSPHVAGAMTLLEGAGITDPMAQRAVLINSARDWNGANTGLDGWSAPQTGWRPEVGWGMLDLTSALAQRSYYRLGTVPEGEASFYRATVPAGSKATMAFQLRGYFVGYPNPGTQTLKHTQSNLDLHQYDSTDTEITPPASFDPPDTTIDPGPDAIDPNDTVEQVRSPSSPGSQTITYKVQSASTVDGAAAEPFAIAGAAPLTPLASPTVRPSSLNVSSVNVRCDQPVTVTTAAMNDSSDLAASSAALTIELPAGAQIVAGPATQAVSGGTLGTSATSESHAWTVKATTDGAKAITVEGAGDAYGTTFRDSSQVTLNADCTPPATSIDSGPTGPTNDATPSFRFTGSGAPAAFECSVDEGGFSGCASPYVAPPLSEGQHTFRVRAIDAVGNVEAVPPSRTFVVDTVPPETTITSGPTGAVRAKTATFTLAGGEGFQCALDDAPLAPCRASAAFSDLAEGSHQFAAQAIDGAGNIDPTPATRAFRVDLQVQGARLTAKSPQDPSRKRIAKVKVAMGEAGSIVTRASTTLDGKTVETRTKRLRVDAPAREVVRVTAGHAAGREIVAAARRGRVKLAVEVTFTDGLGNRRVLEKAVQLRG